MMIKRHGRSRLSTLAVLAACAASCAVAGASASTLNGKRPDPTTPPPAKLELPARTELLTVDWVDAKTSRIAIGGITYALHFVQPRIVLADGSAATNIGYLKAGMAVRIVVAPADDGTKRLAEIRVQGS